MTLALTTRKRRNPTTAAVRRRSAPVPPPEDVKNLGRSAYEEIKRRILSNAYPGGFHVLESALSEELGMSRTPLKEALVRLENEGLVEVMPRRGMRVLPLNAQDIADIYQVLSSLEVLAARVLAGRKDNGESVARLQAEVERMKAALERDKIEAWAVADERFHRLLVDETANPRLAAAARTLLDQSQRFRMHTLRMREKPLRSTRSHERLVAAIRRHDPEKAVAEHSVHKANWHEDMGMLMQKFGIRHI